MEDLVLQPWQQLCLIALFLIGFMTIMVLKDVLATVKEERNASRLKLAHAGELLLDLRGLVKVLAGLRLGNHAEQQRLLDLITRIEQVLDWPKRIQKEGSWGKSLGNRRKSATAVGRPGIPRRKPKHRKGSRTGSV